MAKEPIDIYRSGLPSDKALYRDDRRKALINAYDIGIGKRSDIEIDEDSNMTLRTHSGLIEMASFTANSQTIDSNGDILGTWTLKQPDDIFGVVLSTSGSSNHILSIHLHSSDRLSRIVFEYFTGGVSLGKVRFDALEESNRVKRLVGSFGRINFAIAGDTYSVPHTQLAYVPYYVGSAVLTTDDKFVLYGAFV